MFFLQLKSLSCEFCFSIIPQLFCEYGLFFALLQVLHKTEPEAKASIGCALPHVKTGVKKRLRLNIWPTRQQLLTPPQISAMLKLQAESRTQSFSCFSSNSEALGQEVKALVDGSYPRWQQHLLKAQAKCIPAKKAGEE